jgi:S-DNA-T family DNA segregation ATPase FtsK/SpoIIIE
MAKAGSEGISAILWRRLQEGGFILLSASSLFFFVSLITYHEGDPGWSHTATHQNIGNAAGKIGAWFADVFLYLFGYVAYMFPLMIGYGGIRVFQNRLIHEKYQSFNRLLWIVRVTGFLSALLSGCGLASLHFGYFNKGTLFSAGGVFGELTASAIIPATGYVGASLLLTAIFLAGITLTTGLSWFGLMDILSKKLWESLQKWPRNFTELKARLAKLRQTRTPPALANRVTPVVFSAPALEPPAKPVTPPRARLVQNERESTPSEVTKKIARPKAPPKTNIDTTTLPSVMLLEEAEPTNLSAMYSASKLEALSREVEARLLEFNVPVVVVGVYPGPVITRFELELAAGVKVSKISGLAKDLARALSVTRVRVVEIIPGKPVVGLEIPNEHREIVRLREILESDLYQESLSPLTLALGKDIGGHPMVVNLAKMPHLLVAGTTGSGKSVGVNAMLLSLLYKATPLDVRLILIDPKMLELSIYDGIPHLLSPVVTDMKDAANALKWCVAEMERRYKLMAAVGVRHLAGYNRKVLDAEESNAPLLDPLWKPEMGGEHPKLERLPYIVVIIDEFADMIMVVGKKVEELIARIAQKARAAGIHMILATQRPSVDVITGLIKANVPTRIAFQVSSRIDSRTILDQQGAEQLLGHGDMLYLAPGTGIPMRIHGAFVSDEEVHAVVKALKQSGEPDYAIDILGSGGAGFAGYEGLEEDSVDGEQDELYDMAVQIVTESRKASISNLQRRLKVGYNRAARLIETMELAGVVSLQQANGGREVLVRDPIES